jgi:hypothetical protein
MRSATYPNRVGPSHLVDGRGGIVNDGGKVEADKLYRAAISLLGSEGVNDQLSDLLAAKIGFNRLISKLFAMYIITFSQVALRYKEAACNSGELSR